MINTFITRWIEKGKKLGFQDDETGFISCGSAYLPKSAAPFLSFENPSPIYKVVGFESDWSTLDKKRLSDYLVIGFDGEGNPLCLEVSSAKVFWFDHEVRFSAKRFVNSSIEQLAECLLAYRGELNSIRFMEAVKSIDPDAINPETFWWYEVQMLDEAVTPN